MSLELKKLSDEFKVIEEHILEIENELEYDEKELEDEKKFLNKIKSKDKNLLSEGNKSYDKILLSEGNELAKYESEEKDKDEKDDSDANSDSEIIKKSINKIKIKKETKKKPGLIKAFWELRNILSRKRKHYESESNLLDQ